MFPLSRNAATEERLLVQQQLLRMSVMPDTGAEARDNQSSIERREQAERCRRLSRATYDRATSEMLNRLAETFERQPAPNGPAPSQG